MVRGPGLGDQRCNAVHLFDHSDGCGALAVLCQPTKPISRCLGNYEPYISLCLLNYDALHLTNFVGGAPVCTELDNEELCSQSHSVGNYCSQSYCVAAIEIKQIADVVFVHNHIEVGNTWSALILEAAEPRAQPNIF